MSEPDSHAAPPEIMHLGGRVSGDVVSDGAVWLGRGPILGNVTAAVVVVQGDMRGDIDADLVVVGSQGRVFGRITYGALRTMSGAELSGELVRRPAAEISGALRQLVERALEPEPPLECPRAPVATRAPVELAPVATPRPTRSAWQRVRVGLVAAGASAAAILLVAGSAQSSSSRGAESLAVPGETSGTHFWRDPLTPLVEPPPPDESIVVEADPLRDVYWQAAQETSLRELAVRWNLRPRELAALNPDLVGETLDAGEPVLVHRFSEESPARSLGRPAAGELRRGIPMPEGDAWRLRKGRRNYYGTWLTISNLVHALEAYGRTFPGAPPVRIGDISARSGGTLRQHKSHQSGRDVDLRFVLRPTEDGTEQDKHRRTSQANIDAEKNWFLIRALVDAGSVDAIFISAHVQGWLREAALRDLPPQGVEEYFQYISHEPGHTEHMHVRFSNDPSGV